MRCFHEAQLHRSNCFLTLTYRDELLPEGGSLCVADWQKFAKRLRKRMGRFRYLMCGEYGERTWRPHYHALLFGLDFHMDRQVWERKRAYTTWRSAILEEVWPFGQSLIGNLTMETCEYVARYVTKKLTGELGKEVYGERKPPFITMSRRPGIGSEWLKRFESDVYPADVVRVNGRAYRPPRFYDERLDEEEREELKRKRRRKVLEHPKDLTPDRLKARERVAELNAARTERE